MKKKNKVLIALALTLTLCITVAVSAWFLFPKGTNHTFTIENDYNTTKPEELYENAPIVLIGTYLGNEKTIALKDRSGLPLTIGRMQIETVLKGTVEEETLPVGFYGGTISLQEHAAARDPESLEKQGITDTILRMRGRRDTITLKFDTEVDAREGQRYLLFTGTRPEDEYYTVMADAYGMRPLDEENRALNPDSKQYEKLDFLP
ncbi:hypothetical protein [uncultured Neglectibacter sp.]|uniref:hypothetical protein n=1 Tax=uncultured Neglectibacter sp. TaxID=1924108 RepID=UPI0034DFAE07